MILDTITDFTKMKVKELKKQGYYESLMDKFQNKPCRNFERVFQGEKLGIIAEIKKASPSKGVIAENFDHREIARAYEELKVDAVSVLTEEEFFKGHIDYLRDVSEIVSMPVLRKDFIVDELQLYEAKAFGADAVLLIAGVLKNKLKDFYDTALNIGLHSLVEVHDEKELDEALCCGAKIIGINNRNLKDFTVDINTTVKLMKHISKVKIVISESGINCADDVRMLRQAGVKGLLIGESFMRKVQAGEKLKKFLQEVREA